ncbi:MAG: hypothetical protein R6U15_07650 [Candidatus Izemoplasmatales bacterium]
MGRYTSLLDGMEIVQISENESGYNYYGYSRWGRNEWLLMREKTDKTEYLYAIGKGSFDNAWSARTSKNYKKPTNFSVNP